MTQPPPPTQPTPPTAQSGGLAPNLAAALAYLWITAILFLLIEPYSKNRFVRFHSFQALIFGVASVVISIGLSFVSALIPILGCFVPLVLGLAIFVLWVICVVKAYQNEWFKIPMIGDFAEQQAGPA
jgi:uncharacterized membrane protein